jgi:hypothetical protein
MIPSRISIVIKCLLRLRPGQRAPRVEPWMSEFYGDHERATNERP